MKKLVFRVLTACLLLVCLLAGGITTSAADITSVYNGDSLGITANGAVLLDVDTATILYEKNKDGRCKPASLTKMMTLYTAYTLTGGEMDKTVTITKEDITVPDGSSVANLLAGDILTYRDLYYAMMLPSGNDAANTLAIAISGSEDAFAEQMNAIAQQLGMTNSHFVNAHGFEDENHYTTPLDLTKLCMELVKHEELVQIFSAPKYTTTIKHQNDDGTITQSSVTYLHHHPMVDPSSADYYDGVKGIKTGYTGEAGNCLATYYEKNGRRLIAIVTKEETTGQRVVDTKAMLDYGLKSFATINLAQLCSAKTYIVDVQNADGEDEYNGQLELRAVRGQDCYITVTAAEGAAISSLEDPLTVRKPTVTASVEKGQTVGKIEFLYKGEVLYSADAVASRTVDANYTKLADLQNLGLKREVRVSLNFFTQKAFYIPVLAVLFLLGCFLLFLRERRRRTFTLRVHTKNIIGRIPSSSPRSSEEASGFFFKKK